MPRDGTLEYRNARAAMERFSKTRHGYIPDNMRAGHEAQKAENGAALLKTLAMLLMLALVFFAGWFTRGGPF